MGSWKALAALCLVFGCSPTPKFTVGLPTCELTHDAQLVAAGLRVHVTARKLDPTALSQRWPGLGELQAPNDTFGDPWAWEIEVRGVPAGHTIEVAPPDLMQGCAESSFTPPELTDEQLTRAATAPRPKPRKVVEVHQVREPPTEVVSGGTVDWGKLLWLKNPFSSSSTYRLTAEDKARFLAVENKHHALTLARSSAIARDNAKRNTVHARQHDERLADARNAIQLRCDGDMQPAEFGFVAKGAGTCRWISWAKTRDAHAISGACTTPDGWRLYQEAQLVEQGRACSVSGRHNVAAAKSAPSWHVGSRELGGGWITFTTDIAPENVPVQQRVSFCGHEWARDSTTVACHDPAVTDLSPLSQLPQLEVADLDRSGVHDVSPLSSLAALAFIDLSHTQVADVRALAGMTQLLHLDLSHTRVADASPLEPLLATIDRLELCSTPSDRDDRANLFAARGVALLADVPFCTFGYTSCTFACGEVESPLAKR